MLLVGREGELNLLQELRKRSEGGAGSIAIVTGAVASGKTSLLYAFAEMSASEGAIFLGATGSRAERNLPLGVLRQLVENAALVPGCGEWASARLAEMVPFTQEIDINAAGMGASAARLVHDSCTGLLELSNKQPVLIGIDDVQDVDVASMQWLLYLARRVRSSRVMVALNELSNVQPTHAAFRAELLRQPNCQPIHLAPLTKQGVCQVLTQSIGLPAARQLTPEIHRISGGNPMLVRALLDDQHSAGRSNGEAKVVVGDSYGEAVVSCLYRNEPETPVVALAIAVLDDWATPATITHLTGHEVQLVNRIAASLTDAGILVDGRIRHPMARHAVLRNVVVEDPAELYGRAAKSLYEEGAPPRVVARCLLDGQTTDPWGIETLRQAGELALAGAEPVAATEYLKRALELCTDAGERAAILPRLVEAEWRANPATTLRYLPELLQLSERGLLAGRQTIIPIDLLIWHGRAEEALEAVTRLIDSKPESPELAAEASAARLWLSSWYPQFLSEEPETVGQTKGIAVGSSLRLQATRLLATVLRRKTGAKAISADRILQRHDLDEYSMGPKSAALHALLYAGKPAEVAARCDALLGEARLRHEPTWQAILSGIRAEAAVRQGHLGDAMKYARRALEAFPLEGWGVAVGGPTAALVLALTGLGRYDEAAEVLRQPLPATAFKTPSGLRYLHARGHHHLATGQPQAALADFQMCGELMTSWGLDLPELAPWHADVAQAQLALGHPMQAQRTIEEQLGRLSPQDHQLKGHYLRVLAGTGDPRTRTRLLREAVDLLQRSGNRLELARSLADLSRAHQVLGEATRARVIGRRAYLLAEECEAEPLARSLTPGTARGKAGTAADVESQARPEKDSDSPLSDAEERVARLAARGHTNREIARNLHITVSTVEQHLTRVYRKLQVKSREGLSEKVELGLVDASCPQVTQLLPSISCS
ncbi:AAA family ATPase [Streptomyces sioyaensis]|uniref:helix-turn-helix transcriptional regulator n=1 Tax=Streptomyces sioyaensis TaxID=67364 RepID=UPI0033C13EFF